MAGFSIVALLMLFISIVAAMALAVIAYVIISCLIRLVAYWNLFARAGVPAWNVFVPFLNVYQAYRISIGRVWFWPWLIGNVIMVSLVVVLNRISGSPLYNDAQLDNYIDIMNPVIGVILVMLIVLGIAQRVKLAKAFGRSGGFAVGLALLPDVFLLILGLCRNFRYVRKNEIV